MYLIDTNVFLEMLLDQEKANESKAFFKGIDTSGFCITEFTLYSIGIVLLRLKKSELFLQWLEDMVKGEVQIIRLEPDNMKHLIHAAKTYNLDFDDAYQYASAEKYHYQIVSFDKDFDRTERKRKEPAAIVK